MFSPSAQFRHRSLWSFCRWRRCSREHCSWQGPACGCGCPAPCARSRAPPPPPDVCTCTTYKPVCDTCYHTQPVVTYRDVCRTCYRREPYCVTVPVTRVDCVTCDEGCFKMVWCPRIVTKQVPRTEYRQQVCSRTVPYTVNQRVPQVMTQVVPEYRVRYCPETHTFLKPPCNPCPCPCCPPAAPGCCAPGPYLSQAAPVAPQAIVAAQVMPQQPLVAAAPPVLAPCPRPTPCAAVLPASEVTDPYLRARAVANVAQTNRNLAAE